MIHRWSLARFKSIATRTDLDLRPLTVLAGANSSGKSTLLQSMLLVAQTLASKVERRQLLLNGDTVRLGNLDDIASHNSDPLNISIGWDHKVDEQLLRASRLSQRGFSYWAPWYFRRGPSQPRVEAELVFGKTLQEDETTTEGRYVELQEATFEVTTPPPDGDKTGTHAKTTIKIRRRSPGDAEKLLVGSDATVVGKENAALSLRYEITVNGKTKLEPSRWSPIDVSELDNAQLLGITLHHFLPAAVLVRFQSLEKKIREALDELPVGKLEGTLAEWTASNDPVKQKLSEHFTRCADLESAKKFARGHARGTRPPKKEELSDLVASIRSSLGDDALVRQTEFAIVPVFESLHEIGISISTEFASLRYLGPLRDEPRAVHELGSGSDPRDVGKKGEYTASVLHLYSSTMVDFVRPDSSNGDVEQCTLSAAVHAWVRHFDIADDVTTDDAGKLGLRLYIETAGLDKKLDLTNVGVGVSQVLPIVVTALISEPGAVLLFEQPELHLHPRVQAQLADFLIAVTATGRQCIVETHSEYLVNRLRRRIAESSIDSPLKDKILLYFVERNEATSKFTPIEINTFGAIPEWPSGFFDQGPSESECILRAASQKRAKRKQG